MSVSRLRNVAAIGVLLTAALVSNRASDISDHVKISDPALDTVPQYPSDNNEQRTAGPSRPSLVAAKSIAIEPCVTADRVIWKKRQAIPANAVATAAGH
jgi:hypothetical protein